MTQRFIFNSDDTFDDAGFQDWKDNSDGVDGLTEDQQWREYSDYIWRCLDDERANLDIPVSGAILAYGSAGAWNGSSYGATPCGSNINGIFDAFSGDTLRFYVEDGDVWGYFGHHDGATVVRFREASDEYIEKLDEGEPIGGEAAFLANTASIAPQVCRVYGW